MSYEITDANISEFAERWKSETPELLGAKPRESECGKFAVCRVYAEEIDIIPESKWSATYDAMVGRFARQRYEKRKPVHQYQGRHPLCWAYSAAQHLECQTNKYVQLAPESITEVCGYRDVGFYLDRALAYIAEHGMAPRSMVPQYNLRESSWNPDYKTAAKEYIPLERWDLGAKDMRAECISALLSGESLYCAYNRLRHAMCAMELQKKGNQWGIYLPNTWAPEDFMLMWGNAAIPDEAYCLRAMTFAR